MGFARFLFQEGEESTWHRRHHEHAGQGWGGGAGTALRVRPTFIVAFLKQDILQLICLGRFP